MRAYEVLGFTGFASKSFSRQVPGRENARRLRALRRHGHVEREGEAPG